MSTIKEDDRIRELFYDIQWYHVQLSDMKVGDKSHLLGIEKESNIISINKRNEYKEAMDKAEDELYWILDKVNRIEIRETFEGIKSAEELRKILTTYSTPDDWDDNHEEKVFEYLRNKEIIDQQAYLYNYYSLDPPYVEFGTKIPPTIKSICNESRLCYVFCQYNAAIVLSRTVVETIIKNVSDHFFETKAKNIDIISDETYQSLESIIQSFSNNCFKGKNFADQLKIAKNIGIISDRAYQKANKIRLLGNKVVHGEKLVSKKEAKETLTDILIFLEEVYCKTFS